MITIVGPKPPKPRRLAATPHPARKYLVQTGYAGLPNGDRAAYDDIVHAVLRADQARERGRFHAQLGRPFIHAFVQHYHPTGEFIRSHLVVPGHDPETNRASALWYLADETHPKSELHTNDPIWRKLHADPDYMQIRRGVIESGKPENFGYLATWLTEHPDYHELGRLLQKDLLAAGHIKMARKYAGVREPASRFRVHTSYEGQSHASGEAADVGVFESVPEAIRHADAIRDREPHPRLGLPKVHADALLTHPAGGRIAASPLLPGRGPEADRAAYLWHLAAVTHPRSEENRADPLWQRLAQDPAYHAARRSAIDSGDPAKFEGLARWLMGRSDYRNLGRELIGTMRRARVLMARTTAPKRYAAAGPTDAHDPTTQGFLHTIVTDPHNPDHPGILSNYLEEELHKPALARALRLALAQPEATPWMVRFPHVRENDNIGYRLPAHEWNLYVTHSLNGPHLYLSGHLHYPNKMEPFIPGERWIHFGLREPAGAQATLGLAQDLVHEGVRPHWSAMEHMPELKAAWEEHERRSVDAGRRTIEPDEKKRIEPRKYMHMDFDPAESEQFLNTVKGTLHSQDWTPFLVWSDWMREHGHDELANVMQHAAADPTSNSSDGQDVSYWVKGGVTPKGWQFKVHEHNSYHPAWVLEISHHKGEVVHPSNRDDPVQPRTSWYIQFRDPAKMNHIVDKLKAEGVPQHLYSWQSPTGVSAMIDHGARLAEAGHPDQRPAKFYRPTFGLVKKLARKYAQVDFRESHPDFRREGIAPHVGHLLHQIAAGDGFNSAPLAEGVLRTGDTSVLPYLHEALLEEAHPLHEAVNWQYVPRAMTIDRALLDEIQRHTIMQSLHPEPGRGRRPLSPGWVLADWRDGTRSRVGPRMALAAVRKAVPDVRPVELKHALLRQTHYTAHTQRGGPTYPQDYVREIDNAILQQLGSPPAEPHTYPDPRGRPKRPRAMMRPLGGELVTSPSRPPSSLPASRRLVASS